MPFAYFGTSVVPAEDDRAPHVGQRHGRCFRLDSLTSRERERLPDPDRHLLARAPPRADDLTIDEDGARPDPRRPEDPTMFSVGNEEFPVGSLEQEIRIATWKEPGWRRRPRVCAVSRLVAAKDPSVAKRRPDRRQRPVESV